MQHVALANVLLTDLIPAGLTSASVTNVSAVGIAAPSASITAGTLFVPASGTFDLPQGASVTITRQATVELSVLYPTETDRITLITCSDYDILQGMYLSRV